MTPSDCFWRPFWKSYSLTKAKFYLVNLSNLAKTKKTHRSIMPEQDINRVQIPHPSKATFKFPPSRAQSTVKCPGCARWMFKLQFDRYISKCPAYTCQVQRGCIIGIDWCHPKFAIIWTTKPKLTTLPEFCGSLIRFHLLLIPRLLKLMQKMQR